MAKDKAADTHPPQPTAAKQTSPKQSAPEAAKPQKPMSKAGAVRAAIAEKLDGEEARDWIKAKYGVTVDAKTWSVYKSKSKKKDNDEEDDGEPTLTDLLTVKELAEKRDSVEAIAAQMAALKEMADEVGGFDRLAKCLEALAKLTK